MMQDWRYDRDLGKEEIREELCALSERILKIEEKLGEITRTTG